MLILEISADAETDLLDIWLYIAEDQPLNADRFLDKLYEKSLKLARFPELGKARPELASYVRSFPVDRYIVFYTLSKTCCIVLRVLPANRDIRNIF